MKVCFNQRASNFKPNAAWPMGSSLLPMADNSHILVQGRSFSVLPNF